MGIADDTPQAWVLLTGATGFVGQGLLRALLACGHRVLCLVRAGTPGAARRRVAETLQAWGCNVERLMEGGRLAVVRGDVHVPLAGLTGPVRDALRGRIAAVVHAAGSTRFTDTGSGEPARTNIDGTRHVFALARACECRDWHLVSTAYVAGRTALAYELRTGDPPLFRNAYEHSKWVGEWESAAAARDSGATLTTYRPSVVVGDSESGQATRFVGMYYLFRAAALLARHVEDHRNIDRHAIPLHIPATAADCANVVCIDDVARTFVELFEQPAARGGIYHLTHPDPPTNQQIKRVLESYFDIAGGRFAEDSGTRDPASQENRSQLQELFDQVTQPVGDYLFDSPEFDRAAVSQFETRPPAAWTDERLRRLIAYCEGVGWRGSGRGGIEDAAGVSAYFHDFLPAHAADSKMARLKELDVDVQFCIGPRAEGRWWCRFRNGRVVAAHPGADRVAQVTYRTSVPRFWAAVAGEISGVELFLSGDARVEGDIERALKFAMILEDFVREHPCRREKLL